MATATNTVCSGEILQTQHRRNFDRSRREYFRVLEMKTAELFALSCDLSGLCSRAGAAQRALLVADLPKLKAAVDTLALLTAELQAKNLQMQEDLRMARAVAVVHRHHLVGHPPEDDLLDGAPARGDPAAAVVPAARRV